MRARECCWLWLRPWLRSLSGALRASPAVRPKAHQLQRCSMIGGGPLASSRVLPRWDGWMNGCHDSDQTTTTTTNASIGAGLLPRPFCCRSGLLIFLFLFRFILSSLKYFVFRLHAALLVEVHCNLLNKNPNVRLRASD